MGSAPLGFEEMQLIYGFNAVYVVVCLSLFVIFVDRERRTAMAGLARMNEKVRELAISDPLTGLFNRRHLGDLMASDDARPSDERTIQAVLMIDLDHFKSINDRFGHLVGDRVLKSVAEVIGAQAGADNPVGRFGGEEFVCLVRRAPGAGEQDEARVLPEAIRRRVAALAFPDIAKLGAVTVSIGYADCAGFGGAQAALPEADFALYAAKNAGRDRTQDARARCVA